MVTVFDPPHPTPPTPLELLQSKLQQLKLQQLPCSVPKAQFGESQAVIDSEATSLFTRPQDGAIPTGKPSTKVAGILDGNVIQATEKALLPMDQLPDKARQCNILSGLQHNSLIIVGKLADAWYCTIFMTGGEGVQVFDTNNSKVNVTGEAVLRKWRDNHGLWRVPVKGGANGEEANTIALTKQELIEVLHKVLTYHQLNKPFDTSMQA